MEDVLFIARLLGPFYLLLGLSMVLHMNSWHKLRSKWEEDHFGLFTLMATFGLFGLYIVNTYNVWAWNVWLIVTISGWGMILKSVAYFLLPGSIIKQALKMKNEPWILYLSGVLMLVLGGALTYYSFY